jgi:hypothetical protein
MPNLSRYAVIGVLVKAMKLMVIEKFITWLPRDETKNERRTGQTRRRNGKMFVENI